MNLTEFRALKRVIEFQQEHGYYPHLGGSLRGTLAEHLEQSGYITLNRRKRQISNLTIKGLREIEEAPHTCAPVRASRLETSAVFASLTRLDQLHIRELRHLAETLNIPQRLKLRKRELLAAFDDVLMLLAAGWQLDPTRTFNQWHQAGSEKVTLQQACEIERRALCSAQSKSPAKQRLPRRISL